MRVVVVGAGPTGLFAGMALAHRGHRVTVVDRDGGPRADGSWPRRGVMQFHHPHAFRAQVVEALQAELPEVWDDLLAAGAEPVAGPPGPPGVDGPDELMAVRCRRSTFERVLRAAAERQPGLDRYIGHVDEVCIAATGPPVSMSTVSCWTPIWSLSRPAGLADSATSCAPRHGAATAAPPTSPASSALTPGQSQGR